MALFIYKTIHQAYHLFGYVPTKSPRRTDDERRSEATVREREEICSERFTEQCSGEQSEIYGMSAAFEAETPQSRPRSFLLRLITLVFTRPRTPPTRCQTTGRTQQRGWPRGRKEQWIHVCDKWECENTASVTRHTSGAFNLTASQDFMFH